jgi:rare lipoprotein A
VQIPQGDDSRLQSRLGFRSSSAGAPEAGRPLSGKRGPLIPLLLVGLALLTACVRMLPPPGSGGGHALSGLASWYGGDFHGRRTSNREIYDMYEMTAAHKTLPFGTWVMVTNLDNGQTVAVRINDRGPFVGQRIIDLSYAAASMIDMVGRGVVPVRLDILDGLATADPPPYPQYFVQVGSFISENNARDLERRLRPKYQDVMVSSYVTASRTYFRVRVKAKDREASLRIAQLLSEDGYNVILFEE